MIRTDLSPETQARLIATGAGFLGTSLEYAENLARNLAALGLGAASTGCSRIFDFVKLKLKIEEKDFYFTPCSNIDILERLLVNLGYAYDRSGQAEKAGQVKRLLRNQEL